MIDRTVQVGEAFVGEGPNAAHINTVLGIRSGPVGTAWATALATPTAGHAPFLAVVQPGVAVQPPTLFVNKARVESDEHGRLTWGPAQAGVASGVVDALAEGTIPRGVVSDLLLIAAVWVDPAADDADTVFANNRTATSRALAAGRDGLPRVADVIALQGQAFNPFYTPPTPPGENS